MASKPSSSSSRHRPFIIFLITISLFLIFLTLSFKQKTKFITITTPKRLQKESRNPSYNLTRWIDIIANEFKKGQKIKIGLVNIDEIDSAYTRSGARKELHGLANTETVNVKFDQISSEYRTWKEFFPEWIDEERKWRTPKCPEIPMPRLEDYRELDVVVARVPCGNGTEKEGIRDVFRLQVNLVVANLAVESGWVSPDVHREIYVVFVGSCGPMVELFGCDDMMMHRGECWVYKPDMMRLKQKLLMPLGTCQIAPPYAQTG